MALSNTFALLDKDFLIKLDQHRNKEVFAKIISLNWDEESVAEITGNVVSGSINVDGSSKVRRTCNITLITNQVQIEEISWSLNTKFTVELGLRNTIDPRYEDIIWFPQGMYVISSFSSTLNNSGYTITIQGKDKMCLINGDISGNLFAAHEFSTIYTTHSDGSVTKDLIPIYDIIREAVHQYAQEPYRNIVINDLDTCGVELLDYIADDSILYIFNQFEDSEVTEYLDGISWDFTGSSGSTFSGVQQTRTPVFTEAESTQILFGSGSDPREGLFEAACEAQGVTSNLAPILYGGVWYVLLKRVDPNEINTTAGYRATDITYTGELTVAIGGTITEMLDKIVKMLGEFEYFYDINGRFIFQRKRIYFNSTWTNAIVNDNETYYDSVANSSNSIYDFVDGYLIESFQNKPQINVIKNDFAVWGNLTGVGGKALPIHLRYAIDHKPQVYYSLLEQKPYQSYSVGGQYDWRELIYQMARDNLAAREKIAGLIQALKTQTNYVQAIGKGIIGEALAPYEKALRFHYDYDSLNAASYKDYYYYDDLKQEFVALASEEEYEQAILNKRFLYGPDVNKINLQLTESQLAEMNAKLGYDYSLAQTYPVISGEIEKPDDSVKPPVGTHLETVVQKVTRSEIVETPAYEKSEVKITVGTDEYEPMDVPAQEVEQYLFVLEMFSSYIKIALAQMALVDPQIVNNDLAGQYPEGTRPEYAAANYAITQTGWADSTIRHDGNGYSYDNGMIFNMLTTLNYVDDENIKRKTLELFDFSWDDDYFDVQLSRAQRSVLNAVGRAYGLTGITTGRRDSYGFSVVSSSLFDISIMLFPGKHYTQPQSLNQLLVIIDEIRNQLHTYYTTTKQTVRTWDEYVTTVIEVPDDTTYDEDEYMPLPEIIRNQELEEALLNEFKSSNYIDKTQSELDAWQDTFNTGYDAYFTDMLEFWPHLYRTQKTVKTVYNDNGTTNQTDDGRMEYTDNTVDDYAEWEQNGYWNPQYVKWNSSNNTISFVEPESLFFWIDFFDQDSGDMNLYQYSVEAIGRRSKSVNDKDVKAIYFRETPQLLFVSTDYEPVKGEENLAYARINLVPPFSDYFKMSAQGKSAKEVLDSMLYDATYYQETVTISAIPIYYLEPNTRIRVHDNQSGIDGEYLIKSFSIQLQHDGMMSITANRAVDRII